MLTWGPDLACTQAPHGFFTASFSPLTCRRRLLALGANDVLACFNHDLKKNNRVYVLNPTFWRAQGSRWDV